MKQITVYTTGESCQRCRMTMRRLDERGIPYRVIDVTDPAQAPAREHVIGHLGYTEAPVMTVGPGERQHWSGYRPDLIDTLTTERSL